MRLVTKLPEELVLKAELGITSTFKFKDKEYVYEVSIGKLCILTRRLYNEPICRVVDDKNSIEQINALLASGRFFHQHVDIGIREEGVRRARRRFSIP